MNKKNKKYVMIKQSSALNLINRLHYDTKAKANSEAKYSCYKLKEGNTTVNVRVSGRVCQKTLQLFDYILITDNYSNGIITLALKDILEKLSYCKHTYIKDILQDLNILNSLYIEINILKNKKSNNHEFRLFKKQEIIDKNSIALGLLQLKLSKEFNEYYQNQVLKRACTSMMYPVELFSIRSSKHCNKYAYYIGRKLVELKKLKGLDENSFTVSCETLITVCRKAGMIHHKDIKNRHYDQYIIKPIENALKYLKEVGIIDYVFSSNYKNFSEFYRSTILVDLPDYPKVKKRKNNGHSSNAKKESSNANRNTS